MPELTSLSTSLGHWRCKVLHNGLDKGFGSNPMSMSWQPPWVCKLQDHCFWPWFLVSLKKKKKNIQTDSYSAAPEYQSSAQLYKNMIKVSPITIVQKDSIEKKKLKGKTTQKRNLHKSTTLFLHAVKKNKS